VILKKRKNLVSLNAKGGGNAGIVDRLKELRMKNHFSEEPRRVSRRRETEAWEESFKYTETGR